MIPTATPITEVDNLPGTEVAFSIGNPLWVMKNLAKLYSDTSTAVIREYSTNAVDSHIMAGKSDVPIEVTLPDLYGPYFIVQDYGLGMSEEDLFETYTKFGNSTKRETNDVNGMYGFGSKSAVAYTNQFTIESVKDGEKIHAIVSKRPDYSMTLKVVSKVRTDSPNGVKITIPVHNWEEFRTKAKNFYRFWQPGTVLVDGEEPKQAVGEKIDDNLYFSPNPGVSYVVMGNVGYRIANPDAIFRNSRMNNISFVAYVEGGAVEHTPSREDLEYTDHTKATLHKVVTDFEKKMLDTAKDEIVNAPTAREAWEAWHAWCEKLGTTLFRDMEYKGKKLERSVALKDALKYSVPNPGGYNPRYNTQYTNSFNISDMKSVLFVTNFLTDTNGRVSVGTEHKKKVRRYFEHKNLRVRNVYFIAGEIDSPWVDNERVVTWEDLKANLPKLPRPAADPNRPKRPKGLFDYFTNKGKVREQELPGGADVFYITAKDAKKYSIVSALQAIGVDDSVVVVVLAENRIDKFKRDHFGAREFVDWAKAKVVVDAATLLDDKTKRAFAIGYETHAWVNALDVEKIDDPRWKQTKELLQHRQYGKAYENNMALASALGMRYHIKEYREDGKDESLLNDYPLLSHLLYARRENDTKKEIIIYLNAAYAAKKGKP